MSIEEMIEKRQSEEEGEIFDEDDTKGNQSEAHVL